MVKTPRTWTPLKTGLLLGVFAICFALVPACARQSSHEAASRSELPAGNQPTAAHPAPARILIPDVPATHTPAPDRFLVQLETSKGLVLLEINRAWAPNGADRFFELVSFGYFDQARFFRVINGRWA
jgi:hypothetical protein